MSEFEAGWAAATEAVDEPGYGTAALRLQHLARKRAESHRNDPLADSGALDEQLPAPNDSTSDSEARR